MREGLLQFGRQIWSGFIKRSGSTRAEVGRVCGVAIGVSRPPAGLDRGGYFPAGQRTGHGSGGVQLIHPMSSVETSSALGGSTGWSSFLSPAVIGLGIWLGRGQRNTRDYFLGGRDLPWWGVALSILATETSALTFIGVPAMAYAGDLGFMQIVLGYAGARDFGGRDGAVLFSERYLFSVRAVWPGVRYFGPKTGCGVFSGSRDAGCGGARFRHLHPVAVDPGWSVTEAIFLFVGLSLVYTWFGGIKAVVWTDAFQFVLLLAGGLFAMFYLPTLIDGGWSGALGQAEDAGKLAWLNFDFTLAAPFNFWMGDRRSGCVCSVHARNRSARGATGACLSQCGGWA